MAPQRIAFARSTYRAEGLEFTIRDIREPLDALGRFDFIWIRFVLEYYRRKASSWSATSPALSSRAARSA